MPLIKDGNFVEDTWRHLDDEDAVPTGEPVTVSWARWGRDRAALDGRNGGPLGLRLPNDVPPATVNGDVDRFDLIVLNFPRFTDGRAYSQARLLKARYGFKGELRAAGNVLRDQLQFMRRCGIDSFEVGERAIAENWLNAFADFDLFYQPAGDGAPWIQRLRQR